MADTLNKLDPALIERVGKIIEDNTSMSTRTGMQLMIEMMMNVYKSQNEIIEHVRTQNGRVATAEVEIKELKRTSVSRWIKENPKTTFLIFSGIFVVNSMINWQGIRRPILKTILGYVGIDVPLESLP